MHSKTLFTLVLVLFISTGINAQSKKELKQKFESNKNIVAQENYSFLPEKFISVGESTSREDMPASPNFFKVKGDSLFVELHYISKRKQGVIKYQGIAYGKVLAEDKKEVSVKLATKEIATDGVQFEVVIRDTGLISLGVVMLDPTFIVLGYNGELQAVE